jgi:hypothetical protein
MLVRATPFPVPTLIRTLRLRDLLFLFIGR